jgi:hypothetical protein
VIAPSPGLPIVSILIAAIAVKIGLPVSPLVPGIGIWIVTVWLWPRLSRILAIQSSVVLAIGFLGFAAAAQIHPLTFADIRPAIEANYAVLGMLIGVSFLRLIQNDRASVRTAQGLRGQLQTMLGAHVLGSILNLSILTLLGQRLSPLGQLNRVQGLALIRGFAFASTWSPFFASVGIILLAVPDAQYREMVPYGFGLVGCAGLITFWQLHRAPESSVSTGFSLRFQSLKIPLSMAGTVLITHVLWPLVPILTIVTMTSVLFTLIAVFIRGGSDLLRTSLRTHLQLQLPRLGGEFALFASSALLGAGISAMIRAYELVPDLPTFGAFEAWLTLCALVALALIGLHPVAGIVLAATLLTPIVDDPTLLAIVFAFAWALAVVLSPLSAAQLTLKLGFQVRTRDLAQLNIPFAIPIFAAAYGLLWLRVTLASG